MSIEIKSPTFPESVADGTIANWLKKKVKVLHKMKLLPK